MQAAAHDPELAKKLGIPLATAAEFVRKTRRVKRLPERVKQS